MRRRRGRPEVRRSVVWVGSLGRFNANCPDNGRVPSHGPRSSIRADSSGSKVLVLLAHLFPSRCRNSFLLDSRHLQLVELAFNFGT